MISLIAPKEKETVDTYTPIQNEFIQRIESLGTEAALQWLLTVKDGKERTYPREVNFVWEGEPDGEYLFEVSEREDFTDSFAVKTRECNCTLANPKTGTEYFWRVNGCAPRSFTTRARAQRFIKIDGLLNVRDIGGNKIRQGLIYRGSELDSKFHITEEGKKTFCRDLGIKTDLDLRFEPHEHASTSPAGENVILRKIKYRPYMEAFEEQYVKNICKIMELFANRENYPVYIHCMGGADRTGMIAIFLRAIAGEEENAIHLDYELTGLSTYGAGAAEGADGFRSRNNAYYKEFLNALEKYSPQGTLNERVIGFLTTCGVTRACIEKIAAIIKK